MSFFDILVFSFIGLLLYLLAKSIAYQTSDEEGKHRIEAGRDYERYKNLPKHHVDFDKPYCSYTYYLEAYRMKLLDYRTLVKVTNEYYEYRKRKYGYFDIAKTIDDKDKIPNIKKNVEIRYPNIDFEKIPSPLKQCLGRMTLIYYNRPYSKDDRFIDVFKYAFNEEFDSKKIIESIELYESYSTLHKSGDNRADLLIRIFRLIIEPFFIKKCELEKVDYDEHIFDYTTIKKRATAEIIETFLQDITDESKYKLSVAEAYKVFYAIYGLYYYKKYDILDVISEAYLFNDISYKGYCIMKKKCLNYLKESDKDKFIKCDFNIYSNIDKFDNFKKTIK